MVKDQVDGGRRVLKMENGEDGGKILKMDIFILFSAAPGSEITMAKLSLGLNVEERRPPKIIGRNTHTERKRLIRA